MLLFFFSIEIFPAELKIYDLQSEDFYVKTEGQNITAFFRLLKGKNPYAIIFFLHVGRQTRTLLAAL